VLDDPWGKAVAAQARAAALSWQNRVDDAVATIDRVRSETEAPSGELALTLDAQRLMLTLAFISQSAERPHDGEATSRATVGATGNDWNSRCRGSRRRRRRR
jgi:hypothetical protein